ncbi:DUF3817 domain-containing protein [Actinoplanes awajinensis]|uniref:DUF3817 domain-containing protein n=1 Tax=Actinoplanes awajinensis TaxID=135946 RepID=UPI000A74D7D1|nr:DUF3817 domain-containing protein [Actinoplanes awajinensis]
MRVLRIAALVELLSLVILLSNLATVHLKPITSLCGPIHGCAYLIVVILAFPHRPARFWAWIPGVGGWLAVTRIQRVTAGR